MDGDLLLEWLQSAGLQAYYPAFKAQGITPQAFIAITIQDYARLGVNDLPDKQKLFRLITSLKSRDDLFGPPPAPAPPAVSSTVSTRIAQAHDPAMYESRDESYLDAPAYAQAPPPPPPQHPHVQAPASAHRRAGAAGGPLDVTPEVEIHPRAPNPPNPRGIPTTARTVVPPTDVFLSEITSRIRVVVRKRPLNTREAQSGQRDILTADGWNQLTVHEPKVKVDLTKYTELHTYKFDHVFNEFATNYEIYQYTTRPLIRGVLEGRNATCFAYGQTGAGKTYTMMDKQNGLYVLAINDLFEALASAEAAPRRQGPAGKRQADLGSLSPYVSFFEIYGNKVYDLLNNRKRLQVLEDDNSNVNIVGLQEQPVESVDGLLHIIDYGLSSRSTGATGVNADSSRSHAVLQVALRTPKNAVYSRISFIDLAGSERASDVQNTDLQTRMEGAEINKSLLALKECIRAMDKAGGVSAKGAAGGAFIPFRGSKLTMVLRDSFIGNSQTVMIANVSPNDRSSDDTLGTLRYANRVKELTAGKNGLTKFPVLKLGVNVVDHILGKAQDDVEARTPSRPSSQGSRGGARERSNSCTPGPSGEDNPMLTSHREMVQSIYDLEDQVVKAHRKHVDSMMQLIREEVQLLSEVEGDSIRIDQWVARLESIIARKEQSIARLRRDVAEFKSSLEMEAELAGSLGGKK